MRRLMLGAAVLGSLTAGLVSIVGPRPARARPPVIPPPPQVYATFSVSHIPLAIPNSGPITSVAVNDGNDRSVLVASEAGGAFRSDDGGRNWSAQLIPSSHVEGVAFLQVGSQMLGPSGRCPCAIATTTQHFETAGGGGAYISYRPSISPYWMRLGGIFPSAGARCPATPSAHGIAIAPDSHELYIATDCGIAIGTPQATFHALDVTGVPGQPAFSAVVALAGGHLIAGGPSTGFWYSTNDGGQWSRESTGIGGTAGYAGLHSLAADPRGADRAYAVNGAAALFETTDGGQTWHPVPAPAVPPNTACGGVLNIHAVQRGSVVDLYFGNTCETYVAEVTGTSEAYQAITSTSAWTMLSRDHSDTRDFAADPATGLPYLLTSDGGIEESVHGTDTFHFIGGPRSGLDANEVPQVIGQYAGGAGAGPDLYIPTQHNGIWSADQSGDLLNPISAYAEGAFVGLAPSAAGAVPNKISFLGCWSCSNHLSDIHLTNVGDFHNAEDGYGAPVYLSPSHYAEAVDGNNGHTMGMMYTPDYGTDARGNFTGHWRQIANMPEQPYGLPSVAGAASDPTLVQPYPTGSYRGSVVKVSLANISGFAGRSTGTVAPSYEPMTGFGSLGVNPATWAYYEVLGVDPVNPARMIAADIFNDDVKRSDTGGHDWHTIDGLASTVSQGGRYQFSIPWGNRLEPNVSTISFCPYNDSRILIGTHEGGALYSFDGGRQWTRVDDSEPMIDVTSVYWLAGCSGAYLSTYGRGVYHVGIEMHVNRTSHPCAPAVCALEAVVTHYLLKHHPGPSPIAGLVVSDGYIAGVRRSGRKLIVRVTAGSAVLSYPHASSRLQIRYVSAPLSVPRGKHGQAVLLLRSGGFAVIRGGRPLRLEPLQAARVRRGLRHSPWPARATLTIASGRTADAGGIPLLDLGQPVDVRARIRSSFTGRVSLVVDGRAVAGYSSGTKALSYVDLQATGAIGLHTVSLLAGKTVIASAMFIVAHQDQPGEGKPAATSLTLSCPAVAQAKSSIAISGTLTPAFAGAEIKITYSEPNGTFTDNVTTDPAGGYKDAPSAVSSGTWNISAAFPGDPDHLSSKAPTCSTNVN